MSRRLLGLVVLVCLGSSVRGEPPGAEKLPPPKVLPTVVYPYSYREDPYDIWQYYAVDRKGNFRPRIIYLPGGHAFRAYDGKPYPFVNNRVSENQVIVNVSNAAVMPRLWMPPACP